MLTEYDAGHDFSLSGTNEAGAPRPLEDPAKALEGEKSRTYLGKGFLKRTFTLVAGPLVNIALAFLIVTASLSIAGAEVAVNSNRLGAVTADSAAQAAGLRAGDVVTSVGGRPCEDWNSLASAIDAALETGGDFDVTYTRGGSTHEAVVKTGGKRLSALGVEALTRRVRLSLADAAYSAVRYGQESASPLRPARRRQAA